MVVPLGTSSSLLGRVVHTCFGSGKHIVISSILLLLLFLLYWVWLITALDSPSIQSGYPLIVNACLMCSLYLFKIPLLHSQHYLPCSLLLWPYPFKWVVAPELQVLISVGFFSE